MQAPLSHPACERPPQGAILKYSVWQSARANAERTTTRALMREIHPPPILGI